MENYKASTTEIVGHIKKIFTDFVKQTNNITNEQRIELIKEIGSNWNDERFDGEFVERLAVAATEYGRVRWASEAGNEVSLWKEIMLKNASINNEPHKVADEVISHMKDKFFLK